MKKLLMTTALVASFASPFMVQNAHAETYQVDPTHTNILLRVSHIGFSNMVLEALKPEGTLTFDQNNPENSEVHITLRAANIDGDDQKFNAHLQSADFFNVTEHPVVTFKSTGVEVTGADKGRVMGELTLLGVTKPVALDVTFNKVGVNPFNQKETAGFTATASLNRSDFGMGYGLPAIGDEITVDINLEAIKVQ